MSGFSGHCLPQVDDRPATLAGVPPKQWGLSLLSCRRTVDSSWGTMTHRTQTSCMTLRQNSSAQVRAQDGQYELL